MTLSIEELKELREFSLFSEGVGSALDELIAIREQKGKPIYQAAIERNLWSDVIKTTFDTMTEAGVITRVIFTAPQKPVTKLAGDMARGSIGYGMYAKGWNDRGLADKLAIEAAGGIVKDGE